MADLTFAFMLAYGEDERGALLFARSLRKFGGKLANHPLWLMMPQKLEQVSESTLQMLEKLNIQVHRFEVPEEALNFSFGGKVYAAAAAEELASGKTDVLVWMDSDTVFTGEPFEFFLEENIGLGYRPVMLKNISSLYDEPVNAFWTLMFEHCGTSMDRVFPMLTTVDEVRIRPQFNAGILSLRPEKNLLRTWRDNFERLYQQPELTPFYQEHVLYRIFVHQAILSATLLGMLDKAEMQDLGLRLNFPMFLETAPELARKAVTLRYDEFKFFKQAGWEEKVDLDGAFQGWLQTQVGG